MAGYPEGLCTKPPYPTITGPLTRLVLETGVATTDEKPPFHLGVTSALKTCGAGPEGGEGNLEAPFSNKIAVVDASSTSKILFFWDRNLVEVL